MHDEKSEDQPDPTSNLIPKKYWKDGKPVVDPEDPRIKSHQDLFHSLTPQKDQYGEEEFNAVNDTLNNHAHIDIQSRSSTDRSNQPWRRTDQYGHSANTQYSSEGHDQHLYETEGFRSPSPNILTKDHIKKKLNFSPAIPFDADITSTEDEGDSETDPLSHFSVLNDPYDSLFSPRQQSYPCVGRHHSYIFTDKKLRNTCTSTISSIPSHPSSLPLSITTTASPRRSSTSKSARGTSQSINGILPIYSNHSKLPIRHLVPHESVDNDYESPSLVPSNKAPHNQSIPHDDQSPPSSLALFHKIDSHEPKFITTMTAATPTMTSNKGSMPQGDVGSGSNICKTGPIYTNNKKDQPHCNYDSDTAYNSHNSSNLGAIMNGSTISVHDEPHIDVMKLDQSDSHDSTNIASNDATTITPQDDNSTHENTSTKSVRSTSQLQPSQQERERSSLLSSPMDTAIVNVKTAPAIHITDCSQLDNGIAPFNNSPTNTIGTIPHKLQPAPLPIPSQLSPIDADILSTDPLHDAHPIQDSSVVEYSGISSQPEISTADTTQQYNLGSQLNGTSTSNKTRDTTDNINLDQIGIPVFNENNNHDVQTRTTIIGHPHTTADSINARDNIAVDENQNLSFVGRINRRLTGNSRVILLLLVFLIPLGLLVSAFLAFAFRTHF